MRLTLKRQQKTLDLTKFLKSSRRAQEIFAEAQYYIGIWNVRKSDIIRYAWKMDKNVEVTKDEVPVWD